MTIILDLGNAYLQSAEIEKGLRAGALYAAHMDQPLSGIEEMAVKNLVKTGTLDGTGDYLVPGYATTGDVFVTDSEYLMTGADPALGNPRLPVVLVNAQVPYAPILPVLLAEAQTIQPRLTSDNIRVTYEIVDFSGSGLPQEYKVLITTEIIDIDHSLIMIPFVPGVPNSVTYAATPTISMTRWY